LLSKQDDVKHFGKSQSSSLKSGQAGFGAITASYYMGRDKCLVGSLDALTAEESVLINVPGTKYSGDGPIIWESPMCRWAQLSAPSH